MLFIRKSFGLVSETGGFLVNPGPEPSEPAAVEASELPWRPGAGAGALFAGLGLCAVAHDF